jgi:sugar lactone lactonase YvrE
MLRSLPVRAVLAAVLLALAGPAGAQAPFATGLDGPFRLAQLADGRVLVSEGQFSDDPSADRVVAFNADGSGEAVFAGGLTNPTDIFQLENGDVLVAVQSAGGRLARFNTAGGVQDVFATDLGAPRDVIRSGDRLLVVDGSESGRVVELNLDGTVRDASFITGLNRPAGIAVAPDGRLLVTEGGTGQVLAFNADGMGRAEFADGLSDPSDLLVSDGRVLVANIDDDPDNNNGNADGSVIAFDTDGTGRTTVLADLVRPTGLAELADGRLLVTVFGDDSDGAGSVLAFQLPTSSETGPALATVGAPAPNPTAGASALDVSVVESQRVRVSVYDVLGREVAVAFDGPVAAGPSVSVALDAERLAPGVYVVRVAGEAFAEARRLTVAR